jgi:hypothetical protein
MGIQAFSCVSSAVAQLVLVMSDAFEGAQIIFGKVGRLTASSRAASPVGDDYDGRLISGRFTCIGYSSGVDDSRKKALSTGW